MHHSYSGGTPVPKEEERLQVKVPADVRHEFKVKTTADRESMSAAAARLLRLYVAGQLPQAEPGQARQ